MTTRRKTPSRAHRQSISLPSRLALRVRRMARTRRLSANQVLLGLVERGLEAEAREKQRFLELADQLAKTRHPQRQRRLKEQLARLTFGE